MECPLSCCYSLFNFLPKKVVSILYRITTNILTTICNTRSRTFQKLYMQTTPKTKLKMVLYTSRNM